MNYFKLLLFVLGSSTLFTIAALGDAQTEKVFGEVDPDKALLYSIRPKGARGGNSIAMDLFSDTTFVLQLRGNAYAFAHVEPGIHRIWGCGDFRRIEFVAGETFYLLCGEQGMALLTEDEGRSYIDSVAYYNPPDAEAEANRAKKEERAAKRLPKLEKKWNNMVERIELAEVPTPQYPESVEGTIHVPAGTRAEIELMETVSSFLNGLGDQVWFRVREDAMVEGKIWLRAGTPIQGTIVEIKPARKGGVSGDIEIAIPALRTADDVSIPLVGQFIDTGRARLGKANMSSAVGSAVGGLLGGLVGAAAAPRGREAFELRGEAWHVWSRAEMWIPRAVASPQPQPDVQRTETVEVTARFTAPLAFNLEKHREIPDIQLSAETEAELVSVTLVAVDDWVIPDPPHTTRLSRSDGTTTATFDGWSLLRHMVPGTEPVPLYFEAEAADGRSLTALCHVSWDESSEVE